MLGNRLLCALCRTPTKLRCSLCRSVYYCSPECQNKHWRQGHRVECPRDAARKASEKKDKDHALCASDGSLAKPKKVLFPYKVFVKYFYSNHTRIPCGLINCGNSCYANVVLQCLASTRPLTAYLMEGTHREACQRDDWCFMCELQDHVNKAFSSQMPFSPIKILSRLRSIGNSLGYGRQEDAHEFMRLAVDCMQRICLDEAGGETCLDVRTQETTLIQHIFGGYLQSQVVCCQCQQESNLYENMLDLSVGIQGNVESLEDALKQFTCIEWLDGENKYRCDRCNAYVRAKKRLAVHEAPNILTIALKRFQGGKFGKINKKVSFPEELDMRPYMSGKGDAPPVYRLYAVVVHVDMLNASYFGHYVCYVRAGNGTWFKFDDSKVKEAEKERVMSQKAYMLFYSRSQPRPRPVVEDAAAAAANSSTTSGSDSGVMETSSCREGVTTARDGETTSSAMQESLVTGDLHPAKKKNVTGSASTVPYSSSSSVPAAAAAPMNHHQVLESSDSSIESGFSNYVTNGTQQHKVGKRRWQQQQAEQLAPSPSSLHKNSNNINNINNSIGAHLHLHHENEEQELQQGHTSSCSCNNTQACSSGITGVMPVTEEETGTIPSTSGYSESDKEVVEDVDGGMDVEGSLVTSDRGPEEQQDGNGGGVILGTNSDNNDNSSNAKRPRTAVVTAAPVAATTTTTMSSDLQLSVDASDDQDDSRAFLLGCHEEHNVPTTSNFTAGSLQPMLKRGFLNRPGIQ